jgi:hypothetical protein
MTPKEKAIELFSNYMPDLVNELGFNNDTFKLNKDFALIAVDEIIKNCHIVNINYWQQVKTEIQKL